MNHASRTWEGRLRTEMQAKGIDVTQGMELQLVLLEELNLSAGEREALEEDRCLGRALVCSGFSVVENTTRVPIIVMEEGIGPAHQLSHRQRSYQAVENGEVFGPRPVDLGRREAARDEESSIPDPGERKRPPAREPRGPERLAATPPKARNNGPPAPADPSGVPPPGEVPHRQAQIEGGGLKAQPACRGWRGPRRGVPSQTPAFIGVSETAFRAFGSTPLQGAASGPLESGVDWYIRRAWGVPVLPPAAPRDRGSDW